MTGRNSAPSRLPATELGSHFADADTVGAVALHSGGCGLIIGFNQDHHPVSLMLFRPEPTVALAVGGLRFAQLIAFRALAIGAHVVVQTGRPTAWSTFARSAAPSPYAIRLISPQAHHEQPGTVNQPQLLIVDSESGAVAEAEERSVAGWSAVLTVRAQLSGWDTPTLARADLALMQRLSPAEAELACTTMNVPDAEGPITRLRGDMVALITHSTLRWARIGQTMIERQLIGPIDRVYGTAEGVSRPGHRAAEQTGG